jgi:flagellin
MAMVVKNNMSAVRTLNTLNSNSSALQKSLAKVSSGMKINSAKDDASGYAISERMRVQIRSLDQANQNTQNASSLMKTAEGAVSSTVEILKSLKEKAINAATDTNTDQDRATIQKEIDQFIDQIDDNALVTFNGKYLVDGSKSVKGEATRTTMTNQSLSTDATGFTKLTDLKNRNNENLEIASNDKVTASFVMGGKTYTTTYTVSNTSVQDVFRKLNDEYNIQNGYVATDTNAAGVSGYVIEDGEFVDHNGELSGTTVAYAKGTGGNGTIAQVETDTSITENMQGPGASVKPEGAGDVATDVYVNGINGGSEIGTDGTLSTSGTVNVKGEASISAKDISSSTVATHSWKISKDNGTKADAFGFAVDSYDNMKAEGISSGTGVVYAGVNEKGFTVNSTDSDTVAGMSLVNAGRQVGVKASMDRQNTANGEIGLSITAKHSGIEGQISGLTISISDSEGNVKKSANASLDAFNTTIYAKNESDANELSFHVGAAANQAIAVGLDDMRSEALGLKGSDGSKVSVATQDKANAAVDVFDNAIQKALDQQATIGAIESRLEYTSNNLTTSSENVQAAESTIRDADMAKEMTEYTKNNVLLQAAQSMLAQANQNSSAVLSLLQ